MKLSIQTLYIVSTPIGNLDDICMRSIKTLQNVDIIICENPKHSLKLITKLVPKYNTGRKLEHCLQIIMPS